MASRIVNIAKRTPPYAAWWTFFARTAFKRSLCETKVKCLVADRSAEPHLLAFCIVHYNAPDFLSLNVRQCELLHPNARIYVLDNGSTELCLREAVRSLKRFDNTTLLCARPIESSHLVGLQLLLNYSVEQRDEFMVFLDQDCILTRTVDELLAKLSVNLLLIGPADYVEVPRDYGPLKRGRLRNAPRCIHPSLMILQPRRIAQLFGEAAFSPHYKAWEEAHVNDWQYEPFYSLSYRARGRIGYMKMRMSSEVPLLTSYLYEGRVYAWHAWLSSRIWSLSPEDLIDDLLVSWRRVAQSQVPVSWLRFIRKQAYEFMEQIHRSSGGSQ